MKHTLIIALSLVGSAAYSQNKPVPVSTPVAVIVVDNAPVKNATNAKLIPEAKPVSLPLQKSVPDAKLVTAPVTKTDAIPEMKAVGISANTQKGIAPVNADRPKTSTIKAIPPVQDVKPINNKVVKSIE